MDDVDVQGDAGGRRDFLRKAGLGAAVVGGTWVAPQILTTTAGAATLYYLEITTGGLTPCETVDPTTSSSIGCDPSGWQSGEPAPVNGADFSWTLTENNAVDCTQGFSLTVSDPNASIIEAEAEETCTGGSSPGQRCVVGTINGAGDTVDFPDNFSPETCLYDTFRIIVSLAS